MLLSKLFNKVPVPAVYFLSVQPEPEPSKIEDTARTNPAGTEFRCTPTPLSTTSHTTLVPLFINDLDYLTVCLVCFCTNLPGKVCLRCKQNKEYDASLHVDELKHKEDETVANQNPDSETIPLNQDKLRQQPRTQGIFGTKVPWWIVVMWFCFIAQILGNKTIYYYIVPMFLA